jgi:NitT/TauT family transport system substrate-binding protein
VNALGGIAEIGVTEGLLKAGKDPSKINWVQLPVPSTIAAIQNGTVDAGIINEPFVTQGKDAGLSAFGALYRGVGGMPQAVFVTSQAWIQKNKAVAKTFYDAMIKANTYVATHPNVLRRALLRYTTVDPNVITRQNLPLTMPAAVSKKGLTDLQSILLKYGVMKTPANLNTLVYVPPKTAKKAKKK